MHLTFLGTSAGVPTRGRNVTAQALTFDDGQIWLLDCGEGTQHQLARAGLRQSRVERMLITHLHGDHCLGLVGALSSMGINGRIEPVEVVGPRGIRELLQTVLRLTASVLPYPLVITELEPGAAAVLTAVRQWQVEAVPLVHRVPCHGYVLREAPRPGRFHPELATALGVLQGPAWGRLASGHSVHATDGSLVRPDQVVSPSRPGRLLALLGDTEDGSQLMPAARDCDLLVCEATYDAGREAKARQWGHSSTTMTGRLAALLQARTLIITHFSARYTDPAPAQAGPADADAGPGQEPAPSADRPLSVDDLVAETAKACPGTRVLAAFDLWSYDIPAVPPSSAPPPLSRPDGQRDSQQDSQHSQQDSQQERAPQDTPPP